MFPSGPAGEAVQNAVRLNASRCRPRNRTGIRRRMPARQKRDGKPGSRFSNYLLRYILALSGVEIVSDDTYMAKMKKAQERVKKWHIEAKGNDKYFTFKVKWLTDNYADEDIMRALNHIRKNLMYDYEQIKKKIEEAPSKLKKVKCLENDEVYEDVESAAKALDLTTSLVADQLCGIRKSVKKGSKTYHFRRINEQRRIKK